jgi:type IV pilus assembly protein PilA
MPDGKPPLVPGDGEPASAGKPRRFPWAALFAITTLAAIVAAVLIPSYADYADRAQVAEAFAALGGAKTPLAEFYANNERWPASLEEIGVRAAGNDVGKYVQSIAITRGAGGKGEIELTATLKTEGVDRRVAGKSVVLSSTDGRYWRCAAGTVPEKTLPLSCRESR